MPLAIDNILFVHGYSVRNLEDYQNLPMLLATHEGIRPATILLSAFVSLDDEISCDDLAVALDQRVGGLVDAGTIDLRRTAVIAHSTGAIIVRRWMLNRLATGAGLPSHFISCAGANHGSSLAQLGQTAIAYIFREITEGSAVGKRILEDLDYGSAFLRKLNSEWFAAWNAGKLDPTFSFSMIGTDHSFWRNQLAWQSHENGSDGTVRISSGNLNYRSIDVAPVGAASDPSPSYSYTTTLMRPAAAHLIVEKAPDPAVAGDQGTLYSHTSDSARDVEGIVMSDATSIVDKFVDRSGSEQRVSTSVRGIIEGITSVTEPAYVALKQALSIAARPDYTALVSAWSQANDAWTAANPTQACSTVVVTIEDSTGRPVLHYLLLLRDSNGNVRSVSLSLENNQPIPNGDDASTLSLYVNYSVWNQIHPHSVRVQFNPVTSFVRYGGSAAPNAIDGDLSGEDAQNNPEHVVAPNETTYITIVVRRDPGDAFVFFRADDPIVATAAPYPPFPKPTL